MWWTGIPTQDMPTFSRKQWQMLVPSLSAQNVQQDRGPSSDEATEEQYMSSNNSFGDEKKKGTKGTISSYCTCVVRLWKVQRPLRNRHYAPWPDFKKCSLCGKESVSGSWVFQHITNWKEGDHLPGYRVSLLFPASLLHTSFIILVCFEPCTLQK